MAIDVLGLIADVRQLSSLKANRFYSDADIAKFLSDAASELYDLLVGSYEGYFSKTFDFTLTGQGNSSVLIPRDFYKESLLLLDPANPFPQRVSMMSNPVFRARGAGQLLTNGMAPREFLITADRLEVFPSQNSAGNYQLRYVPQLEELVIPQQVSLDIDYTPGPVNVVARAATSNYWLGPSSVNPGGTWTADSDEMLLVVPTTSGIANPVVIDGVELAVGDIFLVQKPDAPGTGFNTPDPLDMGLWTYNGVTVTGSDLHYVFGRLSGYQGQEFASGFVIPRGLRVQVTEGGTWAGAILVSQAVWTIHTDSVDFALAQDAPITVELMTTTPLLGAWQQVTGNQIYLSEPDDADLLKIDGEQMAIGDLVWFTFDDAPLAATNMGVWRYDGPQATGASFYQFFTRPTTLLAGNSVVGGQNVYVNNGVTLRGATFRVPKRITFGTTTDVALLPLNFIDGTTGNMVLQNAEIDPSYVGGTVLIENSPLGARSYRIATYTDETSAILEAIDDALVSEAFGKPTQLNLTQADSRSTLPAAMTPWLLYIKVHASIAIRTGRQQDTSALETKLTQERGRIIALAANRETDVTQAPITRRRCRYGC